MGLTNNLGKLSNMITSTGSAVGIGTSSPSQILNIYTTSKAVSDRDGINLQTSNSTAADVGLPIIWSSNGNISNYATSSIVGRRESATGTNYGGYLQFATTDSAGSLAERMRITSAGNVGINGTPTSYSTNVYFDVIGNTTTQGGIIQSRNSDNSVIGSFITNVNGLNIRTETTHPMLFSTAAVERMRITSGGLVAIGTTSAIINESSLAAVSNGNTATFKSTLNGGNCLLLWNSSGTGNIAFFTGSSYTAAGTITSSGTVTSYNVTSDYRLKSDYKDYNALDLVSKIKTYDFAWNLDNKRMYGVIAHELQEVIPYSVQGEKDGKDMQGVDYSKLVPILVKAIQELKAEIDELKNK